jgi:hypothetical protein
MKPENLTPKASFQAAPGGKGWSGEALTFDLKASAPTSSSFCFANSLGRNV